MNRAIPNSTDFASTQIWGQSFIYVDLILHLLILVHMVLSARTFFKTEKLVV
jgi:hypothetical protein